MNGKPDTDESTMSDASVTSGKYGSTKNATFCVSAAALSAGGSDNNKGRGVDRSSSVAATCCCTVTDVGVSGG